MTDGWRYIAQRIDGEGNLGEFLDLDLPLSGVNIEEVLSGHNGLEGTITPEVERLKGPDGRPILEEWGTAIWAETPGGDIYGGIVEVIDTEGPNLSVSCIDISGSMIDLPYISGAHFVNADPLDVFRHIWLHAQSQPGGNYGVNIDGTKSPIVIGGTLIRGEDFDIEGGELGDSAEVAPIQASPSKFATNKDWRERGVKVMHKRSWSDKVTDDALQKWLNKDELKNDPKWSGFTEREVLIRKKVIEAIGMPPNPPSGSGQGTVVVNMRPQMNPPQATDGTEDATTGEEINWVYDAYQLNWYTNQDLSSDIDDLAAATPFDWHMTHRWYEGENGDEIRHQIRLGHPRLGRRREDLRFVVGENIKVIPSVERRGEHYANEVLVLGAGEGSAQIFGRAWRPREGKPRRVATVVATWITDPAMANQYAASQLAARNVVEDVSEIVVMDHHHARVGSVDLGDEILLEGETGWAELEIWVRVLARSFSPEESDAMVLTVMRTDRIL